MAQLLFFANSGNIGRNYFQPTAQESLFVRVPIKEMSENTLEHLFDI